MLSELAKQVDREFMETGKDLSTLFKTICIMACKLPQMELWVETMHVINNDDGLTVVFHRNAVKEEDDSDRDEDESQEDDDAFDDDYDDDDYDEDDDYDDEEEMLCEED